MPNRFRHPDALIRLSYEQWAAKKGLAARKSDNTANSDGETSATALLARMARSSALAVPHRADLASLPPDPRLIDAFGAVACHASGLLPWRRLGGRVLVACRDPAQLEAHRAELEAVFDIPVHPALARPEDIEAMLLRLRGAELARRAETTVRERESCRGWAASRKTTWLGGATFLVLVALAPNLSLALLGFWALLTLLVSTGLKIAAAVAALRADAPESSYPAQIARLPTVSVLVALFRESDIASRLIERLGRLDYPRDLLEICLVVEEDDRATRAALACAELPNWMRIIVVPHARLRTKPRALNHALAACRGSVIGVYDAEDAPEGDQIRKVVDRFHQRGPEVACLQGVLDFYNPTTNWLSRCFTVEYAVWFRLILPGLARLGLPLPLGGTTLFFRRAALEELGGWDAHNVTEDADLGMRLARYGYRTELIATTTFEEANCRPLPWVRQRSRWLKGYMMTWATHMRDPRLLYRQLGARGFWGFQALFLGTLSQFLLMPMLWTFGLAGLGFSHPAAATLPAPLLGALTILFLLAELTSFTLGQIGLHRSAQPINPLWVGTMAFYYPLGTLAAYKGLWEILFRPFYWDKTSHGQIIATRAITASDEVSAAATRPRQP